MVNKRPYGGISWYLLNFSEGRKIQKVERVTSGKYDQKYHYFDVLKADWFFLSGALNVRRSPPSQLARAVHAWEAECMRMRSAEGRWPSLAEQRAFLGM